VGPLAVVFLRPNCQRVHPDVVQRPEPTGVQEFIARTAWPALDREQRQRIIAVACSPPPEGRARWTVRLPTEEAIRRKLVPRVGRETIRVLLESHDLKPWREKNVVRGEAG
jgi:hypothetical protein